MTENSLPSPMSMVKIDGAKVKRLREEQGLTQLYLATAVQVTTDTISRWENRRYPSVKKENAIKLAETLNVQLEDLLEEEKVREDGENHAGEVPTIAPTQQEDLNRQPPRKIWMVIALLLILAGGVFASFWYFRRPSAAVNFSTERILPDHCISGQPFPVLIKVTGDPEKPAAFIIKENIPKNGKIKKINPEPSTGGKKGETIKWLRKIGGTETLAYMVTVTGKEDETVNFSGTAAVGNDSDEAPSSIAGDSKIVISHYHWADTDKDNVISDSEILSVYDKYGDVKGIGIDIDQIEEIWLGSGYKWNPATATFEVLD